MVAQLPDILDIDAAFAPPAELAEHSLPELLRGVEPDAGEPATRRIYRMLHEFIVTLRLLPNQLLSINEVAECLGISKTPVREAFIRLAEDGLVTIVPKKGTFVAPIDIRKAFEGYFIRISLESACAAALAGQASKDALSVLSAELAKQKRCVDAGDNDGFFILDNRYHAVMFEVAGLGNTRRLVDSAKAEVDRVKGLKSVYRFCRPERALYDEHVGVFEAIADGDAARARSLTRSHLSGMNDAIQDIAKEERLWGMVKSINMGTGGKIAKSQ
jgi:DNA-binding GntR family transcriptional regulator